MRALLVLMFILLVAFARGQDIQDMDACGKSTREAAPPKLGDINTDGYSFRFGSGIRLATDDYGTEAGRESRPVKIFYRFVKNTSPKTLHYTWPLGGLKSEALAPGVTEHKCTLGSEEKLPATAGTLYYGWGTHSTPANVYQEVGEETPDGWFKRAEMESAPGSSTALKASSALLGMRSALLRTSLTPRVLPQENPNAYPAQNTLLTSYHSTIIVKQTRRLFRIFPLPSRKTRLQLHLTFQSTVERKGDIYNYHHLIVRLSGVENGFLEPISGLSVAKPTAENAGVASRRQTVDVDISPYPGNVALSWLSIGDSALAQFGERINPSTLGTKLHKPSWRQQGTPEPRDSFDVRYPALTRYLGSVRPSNIQPDNRIRLFWSIFNLRMDESGDYFRDIKFSSTESPHLRFGPILITDGRGRLLVASIIPAWSPE